MPSLGAPELIIILAIVIVLFGASRIPEIMRGVGSGIRELRKAAHDDDAPPAAARPDQTSATQAEAPAPDRRDVV